MGCDIHGIFQKRNQETGIWEDIASEYDQDRNYFLFGILAGVRGGEQPISEPRGFPADFVLIDDEHPIIDVQFLPPWLRRNHEPGEPQTIWMGNHSFSWLTGTEMLLYYKGLNTNLSRVASFFDEVLRLTLIHAEIRFVFGFDN